MQCLPLAVSVFTNISIQLLESQLLCIIENILYINTFTRKHNLSKSTV